MKELNFKCTFILLGHSLGICYISLVIAFCLDIRRLEILWTSHMDFVICIIQYSPSPHPLSLCGKRAAWTLFKISPLVFHRTRSLGGINDDQIFFFRWTEPVNFICSEMIWFMIDLPQSDWWHWSCSHIIYMLKPLTSTCFLLAYCKSED